MDARPLFCQRYDALHTFYLAQVWDKLTEEQLRSRPLPQLNSIVWNLWHLTRAEDAGVNRFVADRPQVLYEGDWFEQMGVPYRHHGTGMTLAEVDMLSQRIDIAALKTYAEAVRIRTSQFVATLEVANLAEILDMTHLQTILIQEGVAGKNARWLVESFCGWTKGNCLLHFGLTHGFQHVGEIAVIGSVMGLDVFGV